MRDRALVVAILLLAAAAAAPVASAAPKGKPTTSAPSAGGGNVGGAGLLVLLGVTSVGALALGALAARKSRTPRLRKPPRKSFDAGRRAGRAEGAQSTGDAATRLGRAGDVLKLVSVAPYGAGIRVVGHPKRGRPCEHVAGYLTGLLEAAWSADVAVSHEACGAKAGQPCVYDVMPARGARGGPATLNGSANPTGGSRIPGSSAEHRRWPPARSGGG